MQRKNSTQMWPGRGTWILSAALALCVILAAGSTRAIAIASDNHPNYLDPFVIIGGFMSHFFYAVPLALIVKQRLR